MANDYKKDDRKPPVLDAVLIPYRRAILAIAAMKLDMAERHKLQGAADPFQEWRNLPNAKQRLANAAARHSLDPWAINTKDGTHLHITHQIVGLLMALEKHLEEQETAKVRPTRDRPYTDYCEDCGDSMVRALKDSSTPPVVACSVPWCASNEKPAPHSEAPVMWWTGDSCTWRCTCGAGCEAACVCSRANGGHE